MNKRQEQIRKLYESGLARTNIVIEYYGSDQFVADIKENVNELEYVSDKITLAQMALDFELASKLISESITDEKQKALYLKLKKTNVDLDETVNIELLSDRYSFLGDLLEPITTDIEVQQRLISLSDEKLGLFKQLFNKFKNEVSNPIPIITRVLSRLGTSPDQFTYRDIHIYDSLNAMLEEKIKQGISLSETDKEKLLFLYMSGKNWNIKSLEDLESFGGKDFSYIKEIDKMIERERESNERNITNIQNALLLKSYGISLLEAKYIVFKYKAENIEITDSNRDTMKLYLSLYKIISEKDAGKLIKIYDEFSTQKETSFNYIQPVLIESELTDMFSREFNKVTFKTVGKTPKNIEGLEIYDAGTDFKMIMTSIGAYQGEMKVDNYNAYWNSPHIRAHGNCCSLIANNNLSTATINNICLGFEEFESGMLLRAANYDLNSTVSSRELDVSQEQRTRFMLPDDLINSTRGKYNELVYERRDLSDKRTKFKKNPDYLVFFEEFEGENIESLTEQDIESETDEEKRKILKEQKRIWEETKKAAKDFSKTNEDGKQVPLPIVKVNREECAKSEISKIQNAFNKYLETKDESLLPDIITQFENNRIGNRRPHDYIRENYFSQNSMEEMLSQIINTIKSIEDKTLRCNNINAMGRLISAEIKNFEKCSQTVRQRERQKPGFNQQKYLKMLKEMKKLESEEPKR